MTEKAYRTLDQLPGLKGRRVLVRVDFNVPVDEQGQITDDSRIRGALETLQILVSQGAQVVAMSHRGRPKGWNRADSLAIVAARLDDLTDAPVQFIPDIVGHRAQETVSHMAPGSIVLLENLRFEPGEKASDSQFAQQLAQLGDLYVNDAFGTAHRSDASVVLVPRYLPGYAGQLMARELNVLSQVLEEPPRPYWAIIGGSKVSDKVKLLGALLDRVDGIIVGGGMANTFLVAQGYGMGASKVEPEAVAVASDILRRADRQHVRVLLPRQVVAAKAFAFNAALRVAEPGALAPGEMALDVAPDSVREMLEALHAAKTIFWNGPMGVFEWERFAEGTMRLARGLASLPARVIVGGGDSVAAAKRAGIQDRLAHVSTGGGATLKLLEGETLPGVQALVDSKMFFKS